MPFTDVIDDYSNGAAGTLTTTDGGSVGYTVTANVNTISRPGTDQGAQVTGDGGQTVQVDFDETVHGMTISVNRSNPGEEYFIEIDGVLIDLNDAIADGTVEFSTTGAATHFITASGGISSTGDPANGSLGFLHFQTAVNSVRIFGQGANSGNFDLFDIGIDSLDFRIVCFGPDAMIATPHGPVRAADVRVGDLIVTADHGPCPVVMKNARRVNPVDFFREPRLRPVRIGKGALGRGLPESDLLVSRQHRVLIASRIAERITGEREALVPAFRLVGLPGIEFAADVRDLTYHHFAFDRHEIVLANGAPVESLFAGAEARETIMADPSAKAASALPKMAPARCFPCNGDSRKIVAAHLRHGRALLEALGARGDARHVPAASMCAAAADRRPHPADRT